MLRALVRADGEQHVLAQSAHGHAAPREGPALGGDHADEKAALVHGVEHLTHPGEGRDALVVDGLVVGAVHAHELVLHGRVVGEVLHLLGERDAHLGHEHLVGEGVAEHLHGGVAKARQDEPVGVDEGAVQVEEDPLELAVPCDVGRICHLPAPLRVSKSCRGNSSTGGGLPGRAVRNARDVHRGGRAGQARGGEQARTGDKVGNRQNACQPARHAGANRGSRKPQGSGQPGKCRRGQRAGDEPDSLPPTPTHVPESAGSILKAPTALQPQDVILAIP